MTISNFNERFETTINDFAELLTRKIVSRLCHREWLEENISASVTLIAFQFPNSSRISAHSAVR